MTDSDARHLIAAQGWLELGLPVEAAAELGCIDSEHRAHPEVLAVQWGIHQESEQWLEAVEVGRALIEAAPERFDGWWMLSFALHELKRTQEAYDNLTRVIQKFSREFLAHYNLACYLVQLGHLDEARASLKAAFLLNPRQRAVACEDPDLKPLWPEIQRK